MLDKLDDYILLHICDFLDKNDIYLLYQNMKHPIFASKLIKMNDINHCSICGMSLKVVAKYKKILLESGSFNICSLKCNQSICDYGI